MGTTQQIYTSLQSLEIALLSYLMPDLVHLCSRSLRWRLGLQAMQGITILAFFLGLFFRSASLYHPQRDAISHIKHQKEKVKGINSKEKLKEKKKKSQIFSCLKNRSIRIFLICSSISSIGIYTPIFFMVSIVSFSEYKYQFSPPILESIYIFEITLGLR